MSMNDVKVGDKVKAIELDSSLGEYEVGDILEVVSGTNFDCYVNGGWIEIDAFTTSFFAHSNKKLFTLIPKKYQPLCVESLEIGDILVALVCDFGLGDYEVGDLIEVVETNGRPAWVMDGKVDIKAFTKSWSKEENAKCFALHKKADNQQFKGLGLGVERPDLETRKIGKNRIELVDKGFPNALWEVARLMTKAQDVKKYKDHDWKNLSSDVFSSAASRHRMKHNMGELYDDEFEAEGFMILHKANEAFNVLAELELLLTKEKNA